MVVIIRIQLFSFSKRHALLRLMILGFILFDKGAAAQEQKKIEIVQAGSLEGIRRGEEEVRRLVGDVIFRQDDTFMYCDSALFYEAGNSIDAFGKVRIEGPRAKLSGEVLHYLGNQRTANMTGKTVTLSDGKMTLSTTQLDYDLERDIGEYHHGGKVVDKENVLTSRRGYYYASERMVYFRDSVNLNNPKFSLYSDTLRYNTVNEVSYFLGPTYIYSTGSDSGTIYCEYGWYDTRNGKAWFSRNARIQSRSNIMRGDSLLYDRNRQTGRAWNNVSVSDTAQGVIISGDYAWMDELKGVSFVTGKSILTKVFDTDSLFLHADTLYAEQDTSAKQKIYYAYRHVRIYKPDLQGQCDSLVYTTSDSSVNFYGMPVLWSQKNQLTARHIRLQLADNKPDRIFMTAESFMISMEDSVRYNQVKGRDMTGFFKDNALYRLDVSGNGQSVYHIRNGKKQITGVNQADCSDMSIFVKESTISRISLLQNPDATLHPVKSVAPSDMLLKDFAWHNKLQPQRKEDIFIWIGSR
jgi:lipopolysaccharide export system protein LptA